MDALHAVDGTPPRGDLSPSSPSSRKVNEAAANCSATHCRLHWYPGLKLLLICSNFLKLFNYSQNLSTPFVHLRFIKPACVPLVSVFSV